MLKNVYLNSRFYVVIGLVIGLFVLSHSFPRLFSVAQIMIYILLAVLTVEYFIIKRISESFELDRILAEYLSLHDNQSIDYQISYNGNIPAKLILIDELPEQLQIRNFERRVKFSHSAKTKISFNIRPSERGKYVFGRSIIYVFLVFPGLISYRKNFDNNQEIAVVPSIIQMKKYELLTLAKTATQIGIKKVRQIGENDEFEHIRGYQQGDNIKSINWKATSRRNELMVNQYQNSRSQQVYCVIDKGRSMKQPFDNLTLLDYAINTSLVISNIVLKKYDKMGLISFSHTFESFVKAENKPHQLGLLSDYLYHQKTDFKESNFNELYKVIRNKVSQRSILLLFTNFENSNDLERNIAYLQGLNKRHLLIVILFQNTALKAASEARASDVSEVYIQTFARSTMLEKKKMVNKMSRLGIQTILTEPSKLSVNILNKYLEIKAKRMR